MGKIMDTVAEHLHTEEWHFDQPREDAIIANVAGRNANFRLHLFAYEEQEQFSVYAVAPNRASEGMRTAIAEFVTRANYGLRVGNFEVDLSDGEIRFKVSVTVRESALSTAMCADMMRASVVTMDHYYPGIVSVLFAGTTPSDAVGQVEDGKFSRTSEEKVEPSPRRIGF